MSQPIATQVDRWRYGVIERPVVRVGLIGTGGIALGRYLPALVCDAAELRPVALHDVDRTKAEVVAAQIGLSPPDVCETPEQLLSRRDVDAVLITASTAAHARLIRQAARAGKPMLVEKPAGAGSREIAESLEAVRAAGVLCQVAYNHRSYRGYRQARRWMQEFMPHPSGISGRFWIEHSPRLDELWFTWIHVLDALVFLGGPVDQESVAARLHRSEAGYSVTAAFLFESGVAGSVLLSSAATWDYPSERVEAVGDGRAITIENGRDVRLYQRGSSLVSEPTYSASWETDGELSGYTYQLKAFARAVLAGEAPPATLEDALDIMRLCEAIAASATKEEKK